MKTKKMRLVMIPAALLLLLVLLVSPVAARGRHNQEEEGEYGYDEEEGGVPWSIPGGRRRREAEEYGYDEEYGGGDERSKGRGTRSFVVRKDEAETVFKTEGGEFKVVRGHKWYGHPNPMHIGFIHMEPNTLLVPQYLDANLVLFLQKGEATIGWIWNDEPVVKRFRPGDINRIPAGSTFYIVNRGNRERLRIIVSIDTTADYSVSDLSSTAPALPPFMSFFLGGGPHLRSVLAGFDVNTLAIAFNVTTDEIKSLTAGRTAGPIVYITGEGREAADRPRGLYSKLVEAEREVYGSAVDDNSGGYFLTRLFRSSARNKRKGDHPVKEPDSYNIFDRDPSFRNAFGWSVALDARDYHSLKHSDVGVYYVNLTAGSMLAPHFNPQATEYGVVARGTGTLQIVNPDGSQAVSVEVNEGDVFWVPRFFPFCQVGSRGGQFEFFGFTTSARTNHPQFLVGESSVLRAMMGPELAAGMGVSEEVLRGLVTAQNESVILPTWVMPEEKEKGRGKGGEEGRPAERERERERGREEESRRRERERGREEEAERRERERQRGREEEREEMERQRERGREEERERGGEYQEEPTAFADRKLIRS